MKDSFIFYRSFAHSVRGLSMEDQNKLFWAIINKALDNKKNRLKGIQKNIFATIEPQIEANYRRYENGCKGGAPKGNTNACKTTKKQPNVNENVNENINENVNVNDARSNAISSPAHEFQKNIFSFSPKRVCSEEELMQAFREA